MRRVVWHSLCRTVLKPETSHSHIEPELGGGARDAESQNVGLKEDKTMENNEAAKLEIFGTHVREIPTGLKGHAVIEISKALRELLADVFTLYMKTKNFHWHMHGRHFREYHLLLDEHAEQIFAMTDRIAERARKIGGTTLRSIGDISRHRHLKDNDTELHLSERHACGTLRRQPATYTSSPIHP